MQLTGMEKSGRLMGFKVYNNISTALFLASGLHSAPWTLS
jgi:hypothetical protein